MLGARERGVGATAPLHKAYVEYIAKSVIGLFYNKELYHSWPYCTYVIQDGAPAHRAKNTQLEEKNLGIIHLEWPASSPDLNPIETLWCTMISHLYNLSV